MTGWTRWGGKDGKCLHCLALENACGSGGLKVSIVQVGRQRDKPDPNSHTRTVDY